MRDELFKNIFIVLIDKFLKGDSHLIISWNYGTEFRLKDVLSKISFKEESNNEKLTA